MQLYANPAAAPAAYEPLPGTRGRAMVVLSLDGTDSTDMKQGVLVWGLAIAGTAFLLGWWVGRR